MKTMRTIALFITIWMGAFSIGKAQEISGPQLYQYSFETSSSTSTLTGFYVDSNGNQLTTIKTYTITTTPTTFTALEGGILPTNAVAFIGSFSAPVNEGLSGKVDGTITSGQSPSAGAPIFPSSTPFTWGRMYKVFPVASSSGGGGGGAVTQSGTWIDQIIGVNGTTIATSANPFPVSVQAVDSAPSTQTITASDVVSATSTGANSQSIVTGTPTAGSTASFTLAGQDTVNVQATGTWVGTLQTEVSFDSGTTWYARGSHQYGTSYTPSSYTANFGAACSVGGATNFRVRCTAYTSGTATIRVATSTNPVSMYVINPMKIVDSTIPSQGLGIDVNGRPTVLTIASAPGLSVYALTSTSGTATVTGIYIGTDGAQVGAAVSYSISSGTTLTTLSGGTLPAGAVGFTGTTNVALWVGRGGLANGTITSGQTPASGYPQIAVSNYFTLGKVAP